jgi:hypothetical protein
MQGPEFKPSTVPPLKKKKNARNKRKKKQPPLEGRKGSVLVEQAVGAFMIPQP